MNNKVLTNVDIIKNKIISEGVAHLTFDATEINDIIHLYSIPGYEYLAGGFVEFMERFRAMIPGEIPIILEIKGGHFSDEDKNVIDNAIWTHYGLYLSEVHENLKGIRKRMICYLLLTIISSILIFMVAGSSSEVISNYGYILFWFFGYRVLTHLILDYAPMYRDYQWYRKLAAMKLLFADDGVNEVDVIELSQEVSKYEKEADRQIRKHLFVDNVFMDESVMALGCKISRPDEVLFPSGAEDIEIVCDEMADYLMSALPFIKQEYVTRLEVEGGAFTEDDCEHISKAIRNQLVFAIARQDSERIANRKICSLLSIGLFISTLILYFVGKNVNIAVHEFIILNFWFFADYLLDFVFLAGNEIRSKKKILEKLTRMEIVFKKSE